MVVGLRSLPFNPEGMALLIAPGDKSEGKGVMPMYFSPEGGGIIA
ncbi:MAG: hypothetical protein ACK5L5_06240 [Bacteroidales bacterium]